MRLKVYSGIIVLLLFFMSLSLYSQVNYQQTFNEGVELYTSANYEQAAEKWLSLYREGYRSADLAYNIGNAFFKMNNVPGALLYFERALLISPGNEDIRYNLQIARAMVTDKFKEIPELFFIEWYNIVSLSLSTNTWALTSLVTFIFFLTALSLFFYSGSYRVKIIAFWLSVILVIISLSSLAFSVRNKNLVNDSGEAIIFSPVVNGKSSPDDSGKDLFVLHEGTKVTAGDQIGEWTEVKLPDGNKGWVPTVCFEKI